MTEQDRFLFRRAKARRRSRRNSVVIDPATERPESGAAKQANYEQEVKLIRELIRDKHYSAPVLSS